jgi:hypothetical protein
MNRIPGALDDRFGRFNRIIGCAVAPLALLLLCGAISPAARADEIMALQTEFFSGTMSQTLALDAPGAGTVNVTLNDLNWPAKASLSFFASTDSSVLTSTSDPTNPNSYQFALTGAGAFYAHISGVAGASSIQGLPNFGLFGVAITFAPAASPVPLPASVWLLATGLAGLLGAGLVRRRAVAPGGLLPAAAC